jgi:transposase
MLVTDGNGTPIGFHLAAAHHSEHKLAERTLASMKVKQPRGRARTRPKRLCADRGYTSKPFRSYLRKRGIKSCIPDKRRPRRWKPKRGRPIHHDTEFYKQRFIIERTFAWLGNYRRLLTRWDHTFSVYRGFFLLALVQLCLNRLLK